MGTFMDLAPITGFLQGWANASYREREMALQETRARVAAKNASDEMALRQAQQRWTESIWPAQKDYMTAQTQSLQAGTQAKTAATEQAASYEAAKQEIAQAVKQKILSGELGKLTPEAVLSLGEVLPGIVQGATQVEMLKQGAPAAQAGAAVSQSRANQAQAQATTAVTPYAQQFQIADYGAKTRQATTQRELAPMTGVVQANELAMKQREQQRLIETNYPERNADIMMQLKDMEPELMKANISKTKEVAGETSKLAQLMKLAEKQGINPDDAAFRYILGAELGKLRDDMAAAITMLGRIKDPNSDANIIALALTSKGLIVPTDKEGAPDRKKMTEVLVNHINNIREQFKFWKISYPELPAGIVPPAKNEDEDIRRAVDRLNSLD